MITARITMITMAILSVLLVLPPRWSGAIIATVAYCTLNPICWLYIRIRYRRPRSQRLRSLSSLL